MLAQTIFFYIYLFFFLVPILISGIILFKKLSSLDRFELLFPAGSILGVTVFIFFLNSISYFIKGVSGVALVYLILAIFVLLAFRRRDFLRINLPKGKMLILFILGIVFWGCFIAWKGNSALIGSDTNLYYGVAHTFIKGNFPPMTPWQPNLELSYHLGAFELLGAFFAMTGLSFAFLHVFFSSLFIFLSSQIIIWGWRRHDSTLSFIWGNLAALVVFVSFGFYKFIIPVFPFSMQKVSSLHELFMWIRNLPSVNESIEVYGAPINLDALIYFIFHALGIGIFLSLLVLVVNPGRKATLEWIALMICGVGFSLINESIFIVTFPPLVIFKFISDVHKGRLPKFKSMIFIFTITILTVFYQNGFISNNLFSNSKIESSISIFPKREQLKEDFKAYHYYQQISKQHQIKDEWKPFSWNHIGLDLLLVFSIILLIIAKISHQQKLISLILLTSSIASILAYNFIVPRFLVANGNRFLSFAFIFLSLLTIYLVFPLLEDLRRKNSKLLFIVIFLLGWILIPTIVPPFAQLTKNRFGENKLIPKKEQMSEGINWAKENLLYDQNLMVLDIRAPHPSGVARSLVQAGVFSPIFPGDFRAYTIEASPEYFDIAYYLSPSAFKKLGIKNVLIDSYFYNTLPSLKQQQLEDKNFFRNIFTKELADGSWEKIFEVMPKYFESEKMQGTIEELMEVNSFSGRVYIDNEENFSPTYLRRALIFSLRNNDLYYLPQSGVYLNVESNINWSDPRGFNNYNYLVLSKLTNPDEICECKTRLIWKGLNDEVYLWKRID